MVDKDPETQLVDKVNVFLQNDRLSPDIRSGLSDGAGMGVHFLVWWPPPSTFSSSPWVFPVQLWGGWGLCSSSACNPEDCGGLNTNSDCRNCFIIIMIFKIYSRLLVIRWRSFVSPDLNKISKWFTPALYEWCVQCSLVWHSVILWLMVDVGVTEGSDPILS